MSGITCMFLFQAGKIFSYILKQPFIPVQLTNSILHCRGFYKHIVFHKFIETEIIRHFPLQASSVSSHSRSLEHKVCSIYFILSPHGDDVIVPNTYFLCALVPKSWYLQDIPENLSHDLKAYVMVSNHCLSSKASVSTFSPTSTATSPLSPTQPSPPVTEGC